MSVEEGLLLSDGSAHSSNSKFVPVCEMGNHQKMSFLRKFYLATLLQCIACTVTSLALFLTPGVRGFVQQEHWCRWLVYAGFVLAIALSVQFESRYPFNYMLWLLLSAALALFTTVLATYNDSELPFQVCVLLTFIMVAMLMFCSQNTFKFNKWIATLASIVIAFLASVAIQTQLFVFEYDFVGTVGLSGLFSAYMHLMADLSMRRLPPSQALRASFALVTSLPQMAISAIYSMNRK